MRALTLHLKVLITLLVTLGILITAYQIFIQGIPITEDETDDLWNIDAKVEFQASPRDPIKVQMFVPPLNRDYVSLNESFISNNYGVSINRVDGNRKVTIENLEVVKILADEGLILVKGATPGHKGATVIIRK